MRLCSFFFSLGLHFLIFVLIVYFPSQKENKINLKTVTYQVELFTLKKEKTKKISGKKKSLPKPIRSVKVPVKKSKKEAPVFLPKRVLEKRIALVKNKRRKERKKRKILKVPSKERIIKSVLEEIKKEAKLEQRHENIISKELSMLENELVKTRKGNLEGAKADEVIYKQVVENRIKMNWRLIPSKVLKGLGAKVKITIDNNGNILEYSFIKKSGNLQFDGSIAKAVSETKKLPPPPAGVRYIVITFKCEELL